MSAYQVGRKAQRDMDEIWDYIAADNIQAATRQIRRFERAFSMLTEQPQMAAVCEDLSGEFRNFTVGSYVIYYQIAGDHIEIVRVLHGSRDALSLLSPQGNGDDSP